MENPEVPLENVQEHIEHHAHLSQEKWVSWVALSTAFLAALAAVCALMAGDHADEAMTAQIQASDKWAYYQAKGIKASVLESKLEIMKLMKLTANSSDEQKLAGYGEEQARIKEEADREQTAATSHQHHHMILARGVTLFQIAIAVAAISVLTKRRMFWGVSLIFGVIGLGFLIDGLIR